MSLPATTTFSAPPADYCPTTYADSVATLNSLVETTVDGTLTPYVVSDSTPAVDQQGYLWLKTVDGKPTGLYKFYNGIWRITYTGRIGDVKMFCGDPTGLFTSQGLGIAGGEQDGWHVMNGADGTENMHNLFPVSAAVNPVGATAGWNVGTGDWDSGIRGTTANTGGEEQVTLDATNTYRPARSEVAAYEWTAGTTTGDANGELYGEQEGNDDGDKVVLLAADAGNESPTPFWIVPPYKALLFLQFVGY